MENRNATESVADDMIWYGTFEYKWLRIRNFTLRWFKFGLMTKVSAMRNWCCYDTKNIELLLSDSDSDWLQLQVIEEEEEEEDRWSNRLPQEVVELVLKKLGLTHWFSMAAVCSSWRSQVCIAIASSHLTPKPQFPLLIISDRPYNYAFRGLNDDRLGFLHVFSMQHRLTKVRDCVTDRVQGHLEGRNCVGCIQGWLILVEHVEFQKVRNYFLNPVSGTRVMLPSQSSIDRRYSSSLLFFLKVVATCVPASPESDCIVAAQTYSYELAFCRTNHKTWTILDISDRGMVRDLEFARDGKLYVLMRDDDFLVFDLTRNNNNGRYKHESVRMSDPLQHMGNWQRDGRVMRVSGHADLHLMNDSFSDQLFVVMRMLSDFVLYTDEKDYFALNHLTCPTIDGFKVFKVEHSYDEGTVKLSMVESLGGGVIFVDERSCKFIPSTTAAAMGILERDRVYFAFQNRSRTMTRSQYAKCDVGYYILGNEEVWVNFFPTLVQNFFLRPFWFIPSF